MKIKERGVAILHNPLLNKGTGFTQAERDALGLNGLLPTHVSTVEEQIARSYHNYSKHKTPLGRYEYLIAMLMRNEMLFYQFVSRYAREMLPIIYTPTVGEAAVNYSRIYFNRRGIYISYPNQDKMEEMLANYPLKDIEVIVVTDGERILGLGDQGIGGMTIPVGKLSLYTLFGGIHPAKTLPIFLDVGTNNEELLQDPLYLGWRHKRMTDEPYNHFIEKFVKTIKKRFPKVLLQWEDFGKNNARSILDRYRKQILSFNDDIQGTAAVTLSAIMAAAKITKQKLTEQRIAILGGGSAGMGIADMLVEAMAAEGLPREKAARQIYIIDIDGLLYGHDTKNWDVADQKKITLEEVVVNAKPTVLIGVCAQKGAFTESIVKEMARHTERPIIFPLSNPTSKAECTPAELIEWTDGKAIIATGSPFDPVSYQGKTYHIGQCNNVYIFPGVGVGAIAAKSSEVTDEMFLTGAWMLAAHSPALKDPTASLFPTIEEARGVAREIAIAVSKNEKAVDALMWEPAYPIYTPG